jgi:short subunit dehydrogenase-like uncharacterized protein
MADRAYDLVLFGATGFTGGLTAEYLARSAPPNCRWALAGRSRDRLEAVRERLRGLDESLADLPLLVADVHDTAAVRDIARSTHVVITTVGPYAEHGDELVAACAAEGTDYADLTGEPEFVNNTYVRHQATALRSGARLVHSCGFDSVPHDLGSYFTVLQLPEDVPISVRGYVQVSATFSGGTLASALYGFSRPLQNVHSARARRAAEGPPAGRHARAVTGRPHRVPFDAGWAVPLPTIDPAVVARSARTVERYGPDFRYSHYAVVPNLAVAAGGALAVTGLMLGAQLPPARRALQRRLVEQGDGPSPQRRANSSFRVTFVGEGGGRTVTTRVSGGDPGYDETAKMLAESGLALAFDDLPKTAGQLSPAAAMGDALLERLRRAGIGFEVLS